MNELYDNTGETWKEMPTTQNLLTNFVMSEFKRIANKKDDGGNDFTEKCLYCAQALLDNHSNQSFSAIDFYNFCSPFEIPFEFKRNFFNRFTAMLIENKRCVEHFGAYDYAVYELK